MTTDRMASVEEAERLLNQQLASIKALDVRSVEVLLSLARSYIAGEIVDVIRVHADDIFPPVGSGHTGECKEGCQCNTARMVNKIPKVEAREVQCELCNGIGRITVKKIKNRIIVPTVLDCPRCSKIPKGKEGGR